MKVLIVARYKSNGFAPFITEQVAALEKAGVNCRFFGIKDNGILGYLRHLFSFREAIREFQPDIIHAHYGLSGLFANYQRRVPVVTTYHGSDINDPRTLHFSRKSIRYSRFNIFVSPKNIDIAKPKGDYALIPCGINLDDFPLIDNNKACEVMGLNTSIKRVLFAGSFDNPVKNSAMAKEAIHLVPEAELLELKGYSRPQVANLMQAVDALLLTSLNEGSPQVIKEALACGCPIVSVDVGDVKDLISGVDGCYIAERSATSVADNLKRAIAFSGRTNGRRVIEERGLTNEVIANKLIHIYNRIINR